MPKGPAVVIIARHGARLDAADKQWHLTSPTPYDPPLTYGGWSQAKNLGLRIAALLHARENEATNSENGDPAHADSGTLDAGKGVNGAATGLGKKRKKHKVVLHTSPFLRCIQTSTGIAAGIAQFQPQKEGGGGASSATATELIVPRPAKDRNGSLGSSVLAKSPRSTSPAVQPVHIVEPAAAPNLGASSKPHARPAKILLRIDAFLGEWLSPDYFEHITPPPNSTMMVAGAKADLLRRGDYVEVQPTAPQSKGHFPGGWKSNSPSTTTSRKDDGAFPTMGSLAQALPFRERSSSQTSSRQRSRSKDHHATASIATAHKVPSYIYDPPIPSYAVSPSDPIPRGYVTHARDACVDVDWQWDSMREPQEWGDGGEYGDEWSTMHKRFRKGLAGMMKWYKEYGSMPPKNQFPGFTFRERPKAIHATTDPGPKAGQGHEEEDDEELVLVLVTHGAGCNALLGAISNQPILIDVGLAALSMAVRRDEPRRPSVSILQRRPSVVDPGMSDTYEMKLLASLDHLRPGVDPSKPPQPQSPAGIASPSLEYRRRFGYNSGGTNSPVSGIESPFTLGEPLRSGWNSSLGSMRRSSTSGSGSRMLSSGNSGGTASPMTSSGLWSSMRVPSYDSFNEGRRSPGADMVLNFGNQAPEPSATSSNPTSNPAPSSNSTSETASIPNLDGASAITPVGLGINEHEDMEKHDNVAPLRKSGHVARSFSLSTGTGGLWAPKPQISVNGLWGPPRLEEVFEHPYDTPKRRWTVSERD
ncbi:hypothetical protein K458DRAFT_356935 [Lentithecium fluviatile CBS 122367]|uniref:Phosphoglycerate mutase-like protein n=1 Tax=Lentithecium fluviatile CBS 122367 TaxID=1168545 RepID=A0A6G1JJ63_9PLEO|nr:hypothetical protein K458DRAFT_356935 [Lentithecium fluviatile CBS 122367]